MATDCQKAQFGCKYIYEGLSSHELMMKKSLLLFPEFLMFRLSGWGGSNLHGNTGSPVSAEINEV